MTEVTSPCPYGEALQPKWEHRREIFDRWDRGIEHDEVGLEQAIPQELANRYADILPGPKVLDAFSGLGGVAIALARKDKKVTVLGRNKKNVAQIQHNAAIYSVSENITFESGNFFEFMNRPLKVSAWFEDKSYSSIYLDPPLRHEIGDGEPYGLEDLKPDGWELVNAALSYADKIVALRTNRGFRKEELYPFTSDDRVARVQLDTQEIDQKTHILYVLRKK
jgi:16S rRNA G966 N2-methylase RsmD